MVRYHDFCIHSKASFLEQQMLIAVSEGQVFVISIIVYCLSLLQTSMVCVIKLRFTKGRNVMEVLV